MFNIIAESNQEITPNKMEIIDCNAYIFYTHKYGDKVIITSGLYVFLVIAAFLLLIIAIHSEDKYAGQAFVTITLLLIITLSNPSTYWSYITQTPYMYIIHIILLLILLLFSILWLLKPHTNVKNIFIISSIISIILVMIIIMYSHIPISQSYTYYWLVLNSQIITNIIFIVLLMLFIYYKVKKIRGL
jgi:hypothetical protein